jgi:ribosomal protein L40E
VTSTGASVIRSPVSIPVTVTESHYETVRNSQKLGLQSLTIALLIIGVAGIALVIASTKSVPAQPSLQPAAAAEPPAELAMSKFCRYCGAKIPRDSKFCEECGKKLAQNLSGD